jgi:tetratricopeptide (TPR) repeat protein
MAYAVKHLDEIDELGYSGSRLRPVRLELGITAFGVNAWTAHAQGDRLMPEHDETNGTSPEELYVVIRGRATFELDGERVAAPAGTFVFVPPGVKRTAFAEEPETSVLAVGATPGRPYQPGAWELWAEPYQAGDYAEAANRVRALVDARPESGEQPQNGVLFYNLACFESMSGRRADALEHLRQALTLSEDMRELAKSDSDLDSIRDEPGFAELVGRSSGDAS